MTDTDGVAVTSTGALEGADVSGRDYFRAGRERPFVGDVHPAKLLQALLTPDAASGGATAREPLRLLDVAAPVRHAPRGPAGRFRRGAHGSVPPAPGRDPRGRVTGSGPGRRPGRA